MIYPLLVAIGGFFDLARADHGRLGLGGALAFAGLVIMNRGPGVPVTSLAGGCVLFRLHADHRPAVPGLSDHRGDGLVIRRRGAGDRRPLRSRTGSARDRLWLGLSWRATLVGYLLIRQPGQAADRPVAVLGYGQPVVATALAVPLLGEVPGLGDLAGALVVVAGLVLATRPAKTTEV